MPSFTPSRDVSTIISILPVAMGPERKPGLIPGEYYIPPVANPDMECNTLVVERARFPVYIDENRPSLIVPEPSDRVAIAVVRDYITGLDGYEPGKAEPGLMWAPGEYTANSAEDKLSAELKQLRKLQLAWFKNLVEKADDDWSKYHMRKMISTLQRMAALHLNLDREWNIQVEIEKQVDLDMTPCKFCRAPIHHDAFVCQHCQGILNLKKAQEAGYITAQMLTAPSK